MSKMLSDHSRWLGIAGLAAVLLVTAAPAQPASPSADDVLKKASAFLAELDSFRFEADVTFDDVPIPEVKVQYSGALTTQLRRPDSLRISYRDDLTARELWLSGGHATVLAPDEKLWAEAEGPEDIDEILPSLADDYGVSIPLDDLLFSDPLAELKRGALHQRYVGLNQVKSVPCHHLVFDNGEVGLQLWVDAGETPLVRKVLITYKTLPMAPQYTAWLDWDLNPPLPDATFEAKIPAEAAQIEVEPSRGGSR